MISVTLAAGIAFAALLVGVWIGRASRSRQTVVWREEPAPRPRARDDSDPEIDALLRDDRLIEAIKRHRERTGVGLKEARDAMEARRRELP